MWVTDPLCPSVRSAVFYDGNCVVNRSHGKNSLKPAGNVQVAPWPYVRDWLLCGIYVHSLGVWWVTASQFQWASLVAFTQWQNDSLLRMSPCLDVGCYSKITASISVKPRWCKKERGTVWNVWLLERTLGCGLNMAFFQISCHILHWCNFYILADWEVKIHQLVLPFFPGIKTPLHAYLGIKQCVLPCSCREHWYHRWIRDAERSWPYDFPIY